MLELAILGLLLEQAMHGYELKKQLNQKLGHFWQVSLGSLYPTLNRLAERGAIEAVFNEETSRRKNVYRITPVGEREFLELIDDRATTQWEEEKFPLRFAFFRYVKPEIRIRLLERRRAYLQDKLEDLRSSLRESHDRIDGYTLSLMRHGMDATASDIAWLDELIAAERRQLLLDPGAAGGGPRTDFPIDGPVDRRAVETDSRPPTADLAPQGPATDAEAPDAGVRPAAAGANPSSPLAGEAPFEPLFEGRAAREQRPPTGRVERLGAEATPQEPADPGTARKAPRPRRRQAVERRSQPASDQTRQIAPEGHGHQTAPATGD